MQGACSNQTVKCIVYTNDIEVGKAKLLEIEADKKRIWHINYHEKTFKELE